MTPIQYGVLTEFPPEERESVLAELRAKSGGVCQLCEDPIDVETDDIIVEHKDNTAPTVVENLYLAHRSCNSMKRDMSYDEAKLMIKFRKFCEYRTYQITFDEILDKYVPGNRKPVKIELKDDSATIIFSSENIVRANLMIDPATGVRYCFADVPVEYLHNDIDAQPRKILWDHVWKMLVDFTKHPVHEPSSCRITLDISKVGKLQQFDGQHKTTAQILLGRREIQTKIYIAPDIRMVRDLVLAIQNRIKKMPLAPAIHLEKMNVVYLEKLESSGANSEKAFVETYLMRDRAEAKKEVFSSIYKNIHDNGSNRFAKYVQPEGIRSGSYPLSMNMLLNQIFKHLVCQELQTVQIGGQADYRLNECDNVVFILNVIADELLEAGKWSPGEQEETSTEYMKAKRFFKSGAVKYWVPILRKAILQRLNLLEPSDEKVFLCRPLNDGQRELAKVVISRLLNHPIWTDNDGSIDSKLNENKKETSDTLFAAGTPEGYQIPLNIAYLMNIP